MELHVVNLIEIKCFHYRQNNIRIINIEEFQRIIQYDQQKWKATITTRN